MGKEGGSLRVSDHSPQSTVHSPQTDRAPADPQEKITRPSATTKMPMYVTNINGPVFFIIFSYD
jgi:hypothetical protein